MLTHVTHKVWSHNKLPTDPHTDTTTDIKINMRQIEKSPRREHITPVKKTDIGSKLRIESHIK